MAGFSSPYSSEHISNLDSDSVNHPVPSPQDSETWVSLKHAISASSGFQRWQLERSVDGKLIGLNLDSLVRYYLRETLETLAY
jgi:hypothetical protein